MHHLQSGSPYERHSERTSSGSAQPAPPRTTLQHMQSVRRDADTTQAKPPAGLNKNSSRILHVLVAVPVHCEFRQEQACPTPCSAPLSIFGWLNTGCVQQRMQPSCLKCQPTGRMQKGRRSHGSLHSTMCKGWTHLYTPAPARPYHALPPSSAGSEGQCKGRMSGPIVPSCQGGRRDSEARVSSRQGP